MKVLAGARSALQKTLFFQSGWPGGTEHTEPGGLWGEAPSAARGMSQVVSGIALSPSAVTSRLSCTAPRAAQLGSESAALHGGPGHRGPLGPGISSRTFHSGDESHARVHIEGTSPAKAALHCFPSTPLIERPTLQGMSIQRALMANVPERRDGSRAHRSLPRWGQRRRPIILRFVQLTLPPASGTH